MRKMLKDPFARLVITIIRFLWPHKFAHMLLALSLAMTHTFTCIIIIKGRPKNVWVCSRNEGRKRNFLRPNFPDHQQEEIGGRWAPVNTIFVPKNIDVSAAQIDIYKQLKSHPWFTWPLNPSISFMIITIKLTCQSSRYILSLGKYHHRLVGTAQD